MRFAPSPASPPWPYSLSDALAPPTRKQAIADVIARIRRFDRDGLLTLGSRLLWHFWEHRELTKPATGGVGNYVTWVNAERIISLACTCASRTHRALPKEVDFRLLCWELHECVDTISDESAREAERTSINEYLRRVPAQSMFSRIAALDPAVIAGEALKSRIAASQTIARYWDKDHLFRWFLIARELRSLGLQHGGPAYEQFENRFLLVSIEGFYRALLALLMKADTGIPVALNGPNGPEPWQERGRIDSSDWPNDPSLLKIGLGENDLRAVASRLSRPLSGFAVLRGELAGADPHSAKYSRAADQLGATPIIDLEAGTRCEHLLVPSPWKLIGAGVDLVLYDYVSFLDDNAADALSGANAFSLRGTAFANYLRKALPLSTTFLDVDRLDGLSGKRPDFVWLGNDWGVLIEAKFSFRPNTDRYVSVATSVLETWNRAADAVTQGAAFLTRYRATIEGAGSPKRWVLVLVTSEHANEAATGFANLASRVNFLQGTELEGLSVLDAGDLESWTHFAAADELGSEIARVWAAARGAPFYEVFRVERTNKGNEPELAHIHRARAILLPGAVDTPK